MEATWNIAVISYVVCLCVCVYLQTHNYANMSIHAGTINISIRYIKVKPIKLFRKNVRNTR